jgi:hypothetical protein
MNYYHVVKTIIIKLEILKLKKIILKFQLKLNFLMKKRLLMCFAIDIVLFLKL